ncbi:MAG: helix-turn-helix transcriptional regulator [Pseudohongiella sp.]|nr:helix-turn-helix transcriptional regulator [Pseudohongiella sp.]
MSEKKFLSALSVNAREDFELLASNIAEARKSRGFSQREMASRSLMSLATYQAVEQANPAVSFGAVLAVLDTLELSETLRGVAAPHLDATGRALRASRRMRKLS